MNMTYRKHKRLPLQDFSCFIVFIFESYVHVEFVIDMQLIVSFICTLPIVSSPFYILYFNQMFHFITNLVLNKIPFLFQMTMTSIF